MTRRDLAVAAITAAACWSAYGLAAAAKPVLGSTVFDWTSMEARPTPTGSVRQVVQAPTATLQELEMHVTTLNPGASPHPPHRHADEELIIVREGTVESLVNGQQRRVGPGSVIFQASNQEHGIKNVGETPAVYHVIRWNSSKPPTQ
jgi:XRE family transcriptional regulator, regulator of sulfur utilization